MSAEGGLRRLLRRNRLWAEQYAQQRPGHLPKLAQAQAPEFFWIGCSDSRVPATLVAGLEPGEMFVHRNIANQIHAGDKSLLSALEYAVGVLRVRDIIVCGHYGCGGIAAGLEGASGILDDWLVLVRGLAAEHGTELEGLDGEARVARLAELNVVAGVSRVAAMEVIQRVRAEGESVRVHGLIYDMKTGVLADLGCTVGV